MEKDLQLELDLQLSRGFNQGYLLAKHKPELFAEIEKGLKGWNDNYSKGIRAGGKEFEKEKTKSNSKDANKEKGKDGDFEKEK